MQNFLYIYAWTSVVVWNALESVGPDLISYTSEAEADLRTLNQVAEVTALRHFSFLPYKEDDS